MHVDWKRLFLKKNIMNKHRFIRKTKPNETNIDLKQNCNKRIDGWESIYINMLSIWSCDIVHELHELFIWFMWTMKSLLLTLCGHRHLTHWRQWVVLKQDHKLNIHKIGVLNEDWTWIESRSKKHFSWAFIACILLCLCLVQAIAFGWITRQKETHFYCQ